MKSRVYPLHEVRSRLMNFLFNLPFSSPASFFILRGQTQCWRLPYEWGLGKGKNEASLPPAKSVERLLRTCDLVTQ